MTLPNTRTVISRADHQWCGRNGEEPILPGQLESITNAVQNSIVDPLHHEVSNLNSLLAKLIDAVTFSWDPEKEVVTQAMDALTQVRKVRAYMESNQETS